MDFMVLDTNHRESKSRKNSSLYLEHNNFTGRFEFDNDVIVKFLKVMDHIHFVVLKLKKRNYSIKDHLKSTS